MVIFPTICRRNCYLVFNFIYQKHYSLFLEPPRKCGCPLPSLQSIWKYLEYLIIWIFIKSQHMMSKFIRSNAMLLTGCDVLLKIQYLTITSHPDVICTSLPQCALTSPALALTPQPVCLPLAATIHQSAPQHRLESHCAGIEC